MFNDTLIAAIVAAAKRNGIEPASLLALAECETPGAPFESADGKTPTLLYERHVAWREAAKRTKGLQAAFARAGLAIPKWSRSTQYKDQGTSAQARCADRPGRARSTRMSPIDRRPGASVKRWDSTPRN